MLTLTLTLPMPITDPNQVQQLRELGLDNNQIAASLGISIDELVESDVSAAVTSKSDDAIGPLLSFAPEQIQLARNMIARIAASGDSDSVRLRACDMILRLHSIPAELKYRNAKGMNQQGVVNNIMIAVQEAQERKLKSVNGSRQEI